MANITEEDLIFWRTINQKTKKLKHDTVPIKPSSSKKNCVSSQLPSDPVLPDRTVRSFDHLNVELISAKKAKKIIIEATIDLHGYTQLQAENAVCRFLYQSQLQNRRWVKIITGKSGVLFHFIPSLLKQNSAWTSGYLYARLNDGGAGALYVRIRRLGK